MEFVDFDEAAARRAIEACTSAAADADDIARVLSSEAGKLEVGTTIYQHRETLGRWAESGASAVADGVSSVVGGAGRVLDSIF